MSEAKAPGDPVGPRIAGPLAIALVCGLAGPDLAKQVAFGWYSLLIVIGVVQLMVNLIMAVREVNAVGTAPDTSEWQIGQREE